MTDLFGNPLLDALFLLSDSQIQGNGKKDSSDFAK